MECAANDYTKKNTFSIMPIGKPCLMGNPALTKGQ